MSSKKENQITIRKEIAILIDALKTESDKTGNENLFHGNSIEQLLFTSSELQRKLAVYSYVDSLQEDEIPVFIPKVDLVETIIVPQPEIPVSPPEIVPPIIFEQPISEVMPVNIPVISVEPKKELIVEAPSIAPTKKFPDVKSMIGFNERLMFLNHLFNKDASAYEAAVTQINNCSSLQEAQSFLSVVGSEYKWSNESEPVFIFNSIVKRRFA